MKMFRVLPLAGLMLASAGAHAAGLSYDYVEGSLGEYDDLDGIYVGAAKSLDKQFGIIGALGLLDDGPVDVTVLRAGALFHTPIQKDLDFVATLELVYADWDAGSFGDDDIGFAASGGVRYAVQDNFQLEGKLTVTEVDPFEDGLGISLDGRYYFNPQFSGAIGLASDAEFDGLFLNVRYDFK